MYRLDIYEHIIELYFMHIKMVKLDIFLRICELNDHRMLIKLMDI